MNIHSFALYQKTEQFCKHGMILLEFHLLILLRSTYHAHSQKHNVLKKHNGVKIFHMLLLTELCILQ